MVEGTLSGIGGVSIVVPVYNGAATLSELAERVGRVFAGRSIPHELVFVNDGSEDDSWRRIGELTRRFDCVRGLDLARNVGQHNALLCGIRHARYATIATLDDDLQHPPEEIPKLLSALGDDIDLVYGQPVRHRHSRWRVATSWLLSRLTRMGKPGGPPRLSAFRVFRTRLRDAFADHRAPFVSIDLLLTWSTGRVATVHFDHMPRAAGRSGYSLRKLFGLAFDMMRGFGSPSPWLAAGLGLMCLLAGAAGLLATASWPGDGANKGLSSFGLIAALVLFAGLQLCILAWFGDYLARLYAMAIGRPPYVVARTIEQASAVPEPLSRRSA